MNMAFEDQKKTNIEVRTAAASSNNKKHTESSHEGHSRNRISIGPASSSSTSRGGIQQKRRVGGRVESTAGRAERCTNDDPDGRRSLQVLVERLIGLDTVNQDTNVLCAQILNHPNVMTEPGVLPLYQSYNGKHYCAQALHF
jgi:hypothetical protein